jgi:hypothetical protein
VGASSAQGPWAGPSSGRLRGGFGPWVCGCLAPPAVSSGPLGTAFKPSRSRGIPYGTEVAGFAPIAEGRRRHLESGFSVLRTGPSGGKGTATLTLLSDPAARAHPVLVRSRDLWNRFGVSFSAASTSPRSTGSSPPIELADRSSTSPQSSGFIDEPSPATLKLAAYLGASTSPR